MNKFGHSDLPRLIAALDADGNYTHIGDSKSEKGYCCPCCGSEVNSRAAKQGKEYMAHPRFYHLSEECGKSTDEDILEFFSSMDYDNKLSCLSLISKKNRFNLYQECIADINKHFYDMLTNLENKNCTDSYIVKITCRRKSQQIYIVTVWLDSSMLTNKHTIKEEVKIHSRNGVLALEYKNEILKVIDRLRNRALLTKKKVDEVMSLNISIEYSISNHVGNDFLNVRFYEPIHNSAFPEYIGCGSFSMNSQVISKLVYAKYLSFKNSALIKFDCEIATAVLRQNSMIRKVINELNHICQDFSPLNVRSVGDKVLLCHDFSVLSECQLKSSYTFPQYCQKLKTQFMLYIDSFMFLLSELDNYCDLINNCPNKLWKASYSIHSNITLFIKLCETSTSSIYIDMSQFAGKTQAFISKEIKEMIRTKMIWMASGINGDVRIFF